MKSAKEEFIDYCKKYFGLYTDRMNKRVDKMISEAKRERTNEIRLLLLAFDSKEEIEMIDNVYPTKQKHEGK